MIRAFALIFLPALLAPLACASSSPPSASPPAAASPSSAVSRPWNDPQQLGEYLDGYVEAMGRKSAPAFSGVVAVAERGKTILFRSYGQANRTTGMVADADTRFLVGSIAKQFAAVCILQLAERGRVKLDDTIRRHLTDYPAKTGDVVTIHQLLTHTSGITNYIENEALMREREKPHTPAQVLAAFKDAPLEFPPGSDWKYSNSNYFLLGLIVEKASGQAYESYLRQNVLVPAGMTRTSTADAPNAPNTAAGYELADDKTHLQPARPVDMSVLFSSGALRSTANDLLRWDRALASESLLSVASHHARLVPGKYGYGYGVFVETVAGQLVESHAGSIDGFHSDFTRIPGSNLSFVVLGNGPADASSIGLALRSMLLEGKRASPPT